MPKCEKCGYTRAVVSYCTSCGSNDPYPVRKWTLRVVVALTGAGFLFGSYVAAERTAKDRFDREKATAKSFGVPRQMKPATGPRQR